MEITTVIPASGPVEKGEIEEFIHTVMDMNPFRLVIPLSSEKKADKFDGPACKVSCRVVTTQ